ncbi:MAG: hypothetical protein A2Y38_08150 [Spirochaetes bacterium GWB1_59_5]|nr:MAG: hypothetical protein A2Y38_08150 [Spirochaetes bacterium GWB1_59_5]
MPVTVPSKRGMTTEQPDHRHERLRAAKKRLTTAESQLQLLRGRLQQAQEEQARVEQACRAKGVDPADLDRVITKLEHEYDSSMTDLEGQIKGAEERLAPYAEETP